MTSITSACLTLWYARIYNTHSTHSICLQNVIVKDAVLHMEV